MAPSLEAPDPVEDVIANPLKAKPQRVAPEPEACPGPESEQAGKADACAGCPKASISASTPKGPDPDLDAITARLAGIKHKILVLSGKGGVGKSSLTALLSHAFATDPDLTIGIMDTDICGPSIPKMMGGESETIHVTSTGWSPCWGMDNLCVMSIQVSSHRLYILVTSCSFPKSPSLTRPVLPFLRAVHATQSRRRHHMARPQEERAHQAVPQGRRVGRGRAPRRHPTGHERRAPQRQRLPQGVPQGRRVGRGRAPRRRPAGRGRRAPRRRRRPRG